MAYEIERKFLVTSDAYRREAVRAIKIRQFYLSIDPERTVRVRITQENGEEKARLTVKSKGHGIVRHEWEFEIPPSEALEMQPLAIGKSIEKTRYLVPFEGLTWEVDEFASGLTMAEVELPDADAPCGRPYWVGEEVTGDPRYYNSNMV